MCYYAVFILAVTRCQAMFTTIDKFAEDINLYRVDFIEINAQGHKLNVVRGAPKSIRTFKPRLALSVYHLRDNLVVLPSFYQS